MAYKLSKARKSFEAETSNLVLTLQNCKREKSLKDDFKSHIVCSCVMLCMAQLELYVEDVVSNWIESINTDSNNCNVLPPHLRAFFLQHGSILNSFKRYLFTDDESELLSSLSHSFRSDVYHLASDNAVTPRLYPAVLLKNKYPSPKNLKKYFARIGIPSIFHELNRVARRNTELVLDSFNDIRTAVAHDGVIPGASIKDIINHLKEIRRFVATLDRVLYKHVVTYSPVSYWKV